jgi:pyruvate/2-oxoglutarate dehydrogenase complex dihydrolipoamide dehydrogenase (E3) component
MGEHDRSHDYDVLVLGSGPGGQKAAIAVAKLGGRAAVVEKQSMLGGVCINTGTIPSKTLREACSTSPASTCGSSTGRTTASRRTSPSRTCSPAPST